MPSKKTRAARVRKPVARRDRNVASDSGASSAVLQAISAAKDEILKTINERAKRLEMQILILDWAIRRLPLTVGTYDSIRRNS
jgi:hypothetical protein